MSKRRVLIFVLVFVALAALVYLQFRTWKSFDWGVFLVETQRADPWKLLLAVGLVYSVYFLRALRWKIFLRPVAEASLASLTPPQFIGFTGLALLGRPGELIRPYLIARKQGLSFASQIAVWMVERIFDMGAVAVLLAVVLFSGGLAALPYFEQNPATLDGVRNAGYILIAGVAGVALAAFVVRRKGSAVADWIAQRLRGPLPHLSHRIAARVRAFGEGLNTIHDLFSFAQIAAISLLEWGLIAVAYVQVTHAYRELAGITVAHVVLLMVASMAGSMLQLPAVGGGSQLATIKVLEGVFGVRPELAVSCGVMLWLVGFMAVIPAGLLLARLEHVSLRQLEAAAESQAEE